METKERIRLYKDGMSIYAIAKQAGVSRQSVMRCLERSGVYSPGDRQKGEVDIPPPKMRSEPIKLKITEVKKIEPSFIDRIPFDPADLKRSPGKDGRLGRNLWKTSTGYKVFDKDRGGLISMDKEKFEDTYLLDGL
jgi:hypothetical protein